MKQRHVNPEQAMKQVQNIFKERGTKALEMAKKEVLQEKTECKEVWEALSYFMNEYWHDLARSSLLSIVCEAVGGDPEATTPIAIPMTLISGAIDIHDDVIDQSRTKNNKRTIYGRYGRDIALLVGDALLFKGLTLLGKAATEKVISTERTRTIIGIVEDMFFELGDAEALELRFRRNVDVSPDEYLRVVRKKAADVEAHTRIGAVLGNASVAEADTLGEFGRLLGMMIILRDDWLDVLELGELKSRIERESLPLPLLYCLHEPSTEAKLKSFLKMRTLTQRELGEISETVQKAEALRKYVRLMRDLARLAVVRLEGLKHKEDLQLLIDATVAP